MTTTTTRAKQGYEFENLYARAHAAGLAAGEAAIPTPMIVYEADGLSDRPRPGGNAWYVNEGACGFAWITIRPGNSPFANWAKRYPRPDRPDMTLAHKAYYGGVEIFVHEFNQSVTRKAAYAAAFAEVLRDAGINAYSGSRLD
jgi:hypothetical protein